MSFDLNQMVSSVVSAKATTTRNWRISRVVHDIRQGTFRKRIEPLRVAVAKGDESKAKMLKRSLPGVLWSGRFRRRSAKGLIAHSGLVVADLDGLGGALETARAKLMCSPHLLIQFVSPSGTGLKSVFRVSADPTLHEESFKAVERHVFELTGLRIDPSGKDVCRLCFVSDDPDLYLNPASPRPLLPASCALPIVGLGGNVTPTLRHPDTPDTPDVPSPQSCACAFELAWVTRFLPRALHQTNSLFFTIGRHLLSKEQAMGRRVTPAEVEALFECWYQATPPEFLSDTKEAYFAEFCRICAYAHKPIGDSSLDKAWKRACEEPMPPEARFVSGDVKRLVALCARLQDEAGNGSFFLSCRQIAELFQVEPVTASRWVNQLQGLRVIRCVKKGDLAGRKASEFRYMDSALGSAEGVDSGSDLDGPIHVV